MANYKHSMEENLKLQLASQEKDMELSFTAQEKRKLIHEAKQKDKLLEEYGLLKIPIYSETKSKALQRVNEKLKYLGWLKNNWKYCMMEKLELWRRNYMVKNPNPKNLVGRK